MIRVLLADDHKLFRDGLRQILATTPDIEMADEVGNGEEVLAKLRDGDYSAVIVDISMPHGGTKAIAQIRRLRPRIPLLVLSMHNDPEVVAEAMRVGASGYVTKDCDTDTLLFAIRRVSVGEHFIEPRLANAAFLSQDQPHTRLSAREAQILRLLVDGRSLTHIAGDLNISIKTASTHKTNLMQKLNIDSTAGLVRYALSHRLV